MKLPLKKEGGEGRNEQTRERDNQRTRKQWACPQAGGLHDERKRAAPEDAIHEISNGIQGLAKISFPMMESLRMLNL
jgi:hypothetical protein